MTKEERAYVDKLELSNYLLKERLLYLEERLKYEDPVAAANPPDDHIKF